MFTRTAFASRPYAEGPLYAASNPATAAPFWYPPMLTGLGFGGHVL